MLAPITHILPLATIIRTRLLPVDGKIISGVGQKVNPTDVVAEAIVGRKHAIIDVAQKLGISARQAARYIQVKKGDRVTKEQILAESKGLFGREVVSPSEGSVVAIGGGKIVIETGGAIMELRAGLPGTVAQVIGSRGVVIRATGAVIQGLWGNGKLDSGMMYSLMEKPDDIFDSSRMDVSLRGSILLGGYVDSPKVFQNATDLPVRGLIVTSIAPALIPAARQLKYPVMVLEGFGRRPMNPTAYKLLSTNVKRDIALNAEELDRQNSTRPEVFISLPVSQEPPQPREVETFAPGQVVRVVYLAKPSRLGTIVQLRPGLSTLPSGVKASAADIRLENGEQVIAPLTNLEVLG